jgi:hypothetical protein
MVKLALSLRTRFESPMSTNRYNLKRNLLTGWDVVDAHTSLVAEMPPGTPLKGLRR